MKRARFTARAERDMQSIIGFYEDIAPGLSARIVGDIRNTIQLLRRFPESAPAPETRDLRCALGRRYR